MSRNTPQDRTATFERDDDGRGFRGLFIKLFGGVPEAGNGPKRLCQARVPRYLRVAIEGKWFETERSAISVQAFRVSSLSLGWSPGSRGFRIKRENEGKAFHDLVCIRVGTISLERVTGIFAPY